MGNATAIHRPGRHIGVRDTNIRRGATIIGNDRHARVGRIRALVTGNGYIGRAGDLRRGGIFYGNILRTLGHVAAGIGRRPGANQRTGPVAAGQTGGVIGMINDNIGIRSAVIRSRSRSCRCRIGGCIALYRNIPRT